MSTTIPQRELRNDNARIIDAVMRGETFIVTRNGEAVAELRPVAPRRRQVVPISELAERLSAAGPVDGALWRRDLDDAIDQSL